jgi:SOS-response transcriptional repressor LexA
VASTQLRVRELLKELGWTTKVLAEKTGMSESYLTHIKNGTRRWNEDALKKIAGAFAMDPICLFVEHKEITQPITHKALDKDSQNSKDAKIIVKKVPVVGEIPSYPSAYNNEVTQTTTGFKEVFIPVIGFIGDNLFCLSVENQTMAPRFVKGDLLVISPNENVASGDLAAVEYSLDEKTFKKIVIVNFSDELILLEAVNHKQVPVALIKTKDKFRIIGKVVCCYQRYP